MDSTEIIVIEMGKPGRDGDYAGATEVAALQARADALEARPNITSLDAVPNVVETNPVSGQVLTRSGGNWVNATPQTGVEAAKGDFTVVVPEAHRILARDGLGWSTSGDVNAAYLDVLFGGAGTSDNAAHADHWHTTASKKRVAYTGGGYLSSGSRPIGSTSVTLVNGVTYLVEAWPEGQLRGADAGAAYYRISVTINGNTRTSGSGKKWVVQGVPNDPLWSHERTITGTGAAISISASVLYDSGAGLNVDDGELVVRLTPSR